jgi:hypothetical protein
MNRDQEKNTQQGGQNQPGQQQQQEPGRKSDMEEDK